MHDDKPSTVSSLRWVSQRRRPGTWHPYFSHRMQASKSPLRPLSPYTRQTLYSYVQSLSAAHLHLDVERAGCHHTGIGRRQATTASHARGGPKAGRLGEPRREGRAWSSARRPAPHSPSPHLPSAWPAVRRSSEGRATWPAARRSSEGRATLRGSKARRAMWPPVGAPACAQAAAAAATRR